jgi:chemotaxis methyl-accepting protein methylase
MSQLLLPRPIGVEVPSCFESKSNHDVPMITAFYRGGTFMAEALQLASERAGDPIRLFAISAGCAGGPEVDSLLSLYVNGDYGGQLDVEGYDFNRLAVVAAQRGVYRARSQRSTGRVSTMRIMEDMGFDILQDLQSSDGAEEAGFIVSAGSLRAKHHVRFTEHDLSEALPRTTPADLILANNLLPHLRRPGTLVPVVRNLAELLTDRGVFSFGEDCSQGDTPETKEAARVLREEFGFEPLVSGTTGQPVIFGRN